MKVIYTNATKFAGAGMGFSAYQYARALHDAGFLECAIVAYTDRHALPREKVISFPWMRLIARLARDYHPLRDAVFDWFAAHFLQQCDIVHGWSHQCLRILKRAKKINTVTFVERQNSHDKTQRELLTEEHKKWGASQYQPVQPWGLSRGQAEFEITDFITVPSEFAYESMIDNGIRAERLFLVPRGVDTNVFRVGDPPENTFRLLFAGQVSLRKGIPYLLQAWDTLALPNAELLLAGRVTPEAERIVKPYYNHASIRFLGHVQDIPALYRQVSAFVFPSLEEGSAKVTYEAMASGLPLIFTYNSGAVARDRIEGIEIPIRDTDALAEAIECLYEDDDLRRELGTAGRKRAEEYTWEAAGRRLIDVYRDALSRKDQ